MLYGLSVSNYILIDSLETTFPEGLVIISGETGAGKSILLGALSLVLGAKADASMVGPAADRCVVEAEFSMDTPIRELLAQADLPCEGDRLLLRRTVTESGRSRCFANDEPVPVAVLQELRTHLVDIHSQHQTLRLQDARFRMEALDLAAGCSEGRSRCAEAWSRLQEARRKLRELQERKRKALAEEDYNRTRWQRLQEAGLQAGEMESLEEEEKRLGHAEEIKESLCALEALFGNEEGSPSLLLREAGKLLDKAGNFLPALSDLSERVTSARLEIDDIAAEIAARNSRTEADPQRLQQIQDRLSLLYGLLQKYAVSTVEELMAERDRLETLVSDAATMEGLEEAARKEVEAAEAKHLELCEELHTERLRAAQPFADAVRSQLQFLELADAAFEVALEAVPPGADGQDAVQFLFSASGKQPAEVAKAASGGELSRIMLGIKAVLAGHAQLPTLVFDEIDTGVSGSTADKMGALVCRMGTQMQVFAITHLPQVAAKGHAHYLVSKKDGHTAVRLLDREGRIRELARMLSGATITPAAVANAKTLLDA